MASGGAPNGAPPPTDDAKTQARMRRSKSFQRARQAPGSTRPREPGISAFITRAILLELEGRGIDATPFLARAGLHRRVVEDVDSWVPQRAHAALYRLAIEASGDPAFGVAVGRRVPIQVMRVAGHCAALSSTVREAMETWGRFSDLVAEETRFGVRSTPRLDAVFWTRPPALPPLHDDGPSFAVAVLSFIEFAAGPVRPIELLLTGPPPRERATLVEALGTPVRWNAEHFELRLPAGTLDRPLRFSDPAFRARLSEIAESDLEIRGGKSAEARVRAAIVRAGFDRSARVAAVANLLGTTARTLQRNLEGEGKTFRGVRDEALRDAAMEMLGEEGSDVAAVAFRLGFSSRASFHRAVRRWTGRTPAGLRRESVRAPRR